MGKIITPVLPHDLPENWTDNQYVTPGGTEAGLSEQHGFNYLMKQVNNAQKAINELDTEAERMRGMVYQDFSINTYEEFETILDGVIADMGPSTRRIIVASFAKAFAPFGGGSWHVTIDKTTDEHLTMSMSSYIEFSRTELSRAKVGGSWSVWFKSNQSVVTATVG